MNRRLYIDTNAFFFYLIQNIVRTEVPVAYEEGIRSYGDSGRYHNNARLMSQILQKIDSGEYDGVFSLLVFLELRKKLRAFLCQYTDLDMGDIEETIRKAFEAIRDIGNWYSPEVEGKLDATRASLPWIDLCSEASRMQKMNFGERSTANRRKHLGVKATDALHLALAEAYDCGSLITFDKDFVSARNQIALQVQVIYLPDELRRL